MRLVFWNDWKDRRWGIAWCMFEVSFTQDVVPWFNLHVGLAGVGFRLTYPDIRKGEA